MADAIEPSSVQTGSEAAANSSNLPATTQERPTFSGFIAGIINFVTLAAAFVALAGAAAMLKEQLHLLKERMHRDAAFASKVGEMCGAAGVDAYFVGLFVEAATAFMRVAEASGELAGAADQMESDARGVKNAHDTQYRGIYEYRQSRPYKQPKPGFNKVR
jgi:hypothetical protein